MVARRRALADTSFFVGLEAERVAEQILAEFFVFDSFTLNDQTIEFALHPERMRGDIARFDILNKIVGVRDRHEVGGGQFFWRVTEQVAQVTIDSKKRALETRLCDADQRLVKRRLVNALALDQCGVG